MLFQPVACRVIAVSASSVMLRPEKPFVVCSAVRRSTAAEPQKNEAFHLSRPRWMMP